MFFLGTSHGNISQLIKQQKCRTKWKDNRKPKNPKPKTVGLVLTENKNKAKTQLLKSTVIGWMYTVTDVTVTSTLAQKNVST